MSSFWPRPIVIAGVLAADGSPAPTEPSVTATFVAAPSWAIRSVPPDSSATSLPPSRAVVAMLAVRTALPLRSFRS